MKIRFACAVFAAFVTGPAIAVPPTVFGLQLGQPIELPDCVEKVVGSLRLFDPLQPRTCVAPPSKRFVSQTLERGIWFPAAEAPTIVKNWNLRPLEVDGRLEGIRFWTLGLASQDLVLQSLIEKFGKPSSRSTRHIKTATGLDADAIVADWRTADVVVHFEAVEDRIDFGSVTIDTPVGARRRADAEAAVIDSQKKL